MSLRWRLMLATLVVVGVTLLASASLVYVAFSRQLTMAFDARLLDEARTVANMVEERTALPWEWEPGVMGDFDRVAEPAYFQVWMDDGSEIAGSPSLKGQQLPLDRTSSSRDFVLPDGRIGRLLTVALEPRLDNQGPTTSSGRRVWVSVARGTRELHGALYALRWLLVCGALVGIALSTFAASWSVRLGLRPLHGLTAAVDAVDAGSLDRPFLVTGLPAELITMVETLNSLLVRLARAFSREQRFSTDVSHELRNPLAALRTLLEVTLSRERAPEAYRAALGDALQVVVQVSALAEKLLLLGRIESGAPLSAKAPISLSAVVDECVTSCAALAASRELVIDNRVGGEVVVVSDLPLLRIAVGNLVGNAVEYTAVGGRIVIDSDFDNGLVLVVKDSGPPIPADVVPHLFERFFRGDPGRGQTEAHSGIGLSLVSAVATSLELQATVSNEADGWVSFMLRSR